MDFKDTVKLDIRPEMARALPGIERAYKRAVDRGAFITSANDSVHGAHSLHPAGLALDLRTRDLSVEQKANLVVELRRELNGSGDVPYNVVLETDHIHVEYDPDKGA